MPKSSGFSLPGALMLVAFVGIVAANLSRLVTDSTLSQKAIEARLAANSLRLGILRHLSDPDTCIANFELVDPRSNYPDPERIINIAGGPAYAEEFAFNQRTYEGGKVLVRNIDFKRFNELEAGSEFGVAILQIDFESSVNISGPRELSSVSRPILLSVHLNPSGRIVECAAIGDDEGNFWQIMRVGQASTGNIIYSGRNVGIGTMNPTAKLTVQGGFEVQNRIEVESLNVSSEIIAANFMANQFYHSSDRSLKTDIRSGPGLDLARQLKGVTFRWKDSQKSAMGVIAQDVQRALKSDEVSPEESGDKYVDPSEIYSILLNAIRELEVGQKLLLERLEGLDDKVSKNE